MRISVIIKTYNEEKNIANSIESALKAIKGLNGEVIVVDSLSNDKTVEIAKKYPIKIVQINKKFIIKTPASALEVGYRASKGDFIYVLDGDMILDKNFIKKVLPLFKDKSIAGIGGLPNEPYSENIISKRVQEKYRNIKTGYVKYLDSGGLYKRSAIEKVGYLANPYLFAGEESELGFELIKCNYRLLRINHPYITHYRRDEPPIKALINKWKSGYMFGFGQVLRLSLKSGYFIEYLFKLRIYVFTFIWLLLFLIVIFSVFFTNLLIKGYLIVTGILLVILLIYKKSLKDLSFSLLSWTLRSVGTFIGFLMPKKTAKDYNLEFKALK